MRAVGRIAAAAMLAAGAVAMAPASPAHAAGRVFISSHDGRCLDADVATPTRNGTKVQTWQCNGWLNQSWNVYSDGSIRSRHDGRCLDADIAGGTRNGTKVQLWDCNGWLNQKWTLNADGSIVSRHDGRCLDEDIAGGTRNGTKVQVWDCNGWLNQKWHG